MAKNNNNGYLINFIIVCICFIFYSCSINTPAQNNSVGPTIVYIHDTVYVYDTVYPELPASSADLRLCVKKAYDWELGVRELTGHNDGERVQEYLAASGLQGNYPWCAASVNFILLQCGVDLKLNAPAWVPSYFPRDKLIYVRGEMDFKKQPQPGDLIGIWFASKERLAHIGFYDGENDKYYFTTEGNTNEAGSREGDGFYRKRRPKRTIHSISNWLD